MKMMEVDHISYIFGSFSRRRQSQDVSSAKRRSIEPTRVQHDRSKSAPHSSKTELTSCSSRAKSLCESPSDDAKYKCLICQKHFLEPRVLPCLHTFCTKCLQELECSDAVTWNNGSDVSSGSGNGSGGSGYASEKLETSDSIWSHSTKILTCPACGARADLPAEGVLGFPPNYLVQHRMVLATLNAHTTKLLCDLCPNDVTACARCTECAVSMCAKCAELHRKQRYAGHHEVLELEEARRRGITRVRRQLMCTTHPEKELSSFCSSCSQVVCRDCINTTHRSHTVELIAKAAKSHTTNIRIAVERAKSIAEKSSAAAFKLETSSKRLEAQCNQIQMEIERFMDSYIRAVEEHRNSLYQQLHQTRNEKLLGIEEHKLDLQKRLKDTRDAVSFADELLKEGTDVEVLSFVKPILRRLEQCYKLDGLQDLKVSESLQFLPEELAQNADTCCPLYGVITSQTISVPNCVLHAEGLQNLRVGRRAEVVLETRDRSDSPLQRGGEQVTAELRHRDAGTSRTLQVHVEDCRDGTYKLSFVPDVAGKLMFSAFVKGQLIKECPTAILVRTLRPHHGTFHCCSFCSSGGSKEAACGCGGKMPGGYRGCGHGHDGHPGRRHWSCCGNILEHSECVRTNSITHYQFTL